MIAWKDFEKNAAKYLNDNISIKGILFESKGESDSNASDIEVLYKNRLIFSIECKLSPAQSSQFVVKAIDNKFIYSEENRSNKNGSSEIIAHMNKNYQYYSNNSRSVDLICSKELMYKRVVSQLSNKSKFFISSAVADHFSQSNPLVFDYLENLPNYFDITGTYRNKRSGTSYATKKHLVGLNNFKQHGDKFYIHDPAGKLESYPTTNQLIFLPPPDANGYRVIKKRSSTNNRNVIFSLKLKVDLENSSYELIKKHIASLISS